MAENHNQKSAKKQYKKRYNRSPQTVERNNQYNKSEYEFNSYKSAVAYSNYYFGFDIFTCYSQEQLADLVRDPMGNNKLLREISLILYGTNGVFTNTVDYLTAMPTLDRVIVPHGKSPNRKRMNKDLMDSTY